MHFDYYDDSRFKKIIKEDENHLLFESLNNLGQLDGILLINKKHLIHTVHQSTELDYYQYLVNYHHKQSTFNPRNLKIDYPQSELKSAIKKQELVGIDNYAFDNTNIGVVTATFEDYFLLQNLNDYSLSDSIQKIHFDDLIAVKLTSNTQVLLTNYLNR